MNAIEFLRNQRNNNIDNNINIKKKIEPKEDLEEFENFKKDLTIDDVLYGRFGKNKKNVTVEKMKELNKDGKPKINKKNSKILKMFLQQEADKINDMPF